MKYLHPHQSGFSHIAIFLIIFVLAGVGFAGWYVMKNEDSKSSQNNQSQNSNNQNQSKNTEAEKDIELQNLGITSISDGVAIDTNATRDFTSRGLKGYYNFGEPLEGNRINPNFEFASIKPGTAIIAAIDGIIGFTKQQPESKDYEVFLQPKNGSMWTIGYDHLVNVTVKQGDTVKAGDKLGEAAPQNNGLLRFEIQINKDQAGQTTHICPTSLLASSVKSKIIEDLTQMQNNWEKTTGLELYDVTKQNPVGCLKPTLSPAQAESRS